MPARASCNAKRSSGVRSLGWRPRPSCGRRTSRLFGTFSPRCAHDSRRCASARRYRALLRALIGECLAALPAATVLRVDARDERLAAELLGELEVEVELQVVADLETAGGVELEHDDGRAVRNTIEERLANAEPTLRLLFGEALAG